jgi:hypothetical protein
LLFLLAATPSEDASGDSNEFGCVERFMTATAPRLAAHLRRRAEPVRHEAQGRVRGRIDWAATYKACGGPEPRMRYICRVNQPDFNQPENQLLLFLLGAVEQSLTRIGQNPGLDCGTLNCTIPSHERLAALASQLRCVRREMPGPGAITLPARITPPHLRAASTARAPAYAELPRVYELYRDLIVRPSRERWAHALRETLPLPVAVRHLLSMEGGNHGR